MKQTSGSLLLPFLHLLCAAVVIPAPQGMYGVDITEMVLTDTSRLDPFALDLVNRSVIVSAFHPVALRSECDWKQVPYMPKQAAAFMDKASALPEGTFESFWMQACSPKRRQSHTRHRSWSNTEIPLVLMSPGGQKSRLHYSLIAQAVASRGYTVVTIDHPYDAQFVVFPDGDLVTTAVQDPGVEVLVDTRISDTRFVLDELTKPRVVHHLFPGASRDCGPDTNRVAMIGHSLGGITAMLVPAKDSRFIGALNMDGWIDLQSLLQDEIGVPVLLFERIDTHQPYWPKIWPHLLDWKLWLRLEGSAHDTFTDFPYLVHLLGLEPVSPELAMMIGRVPGDRALELISTYVGAFLDFVLKGKHQKLLEGSTEKFAEVDYVRS
ncbi:hypothetical protein LTR17_014523 [Elasticomyces elasticus]|nr:hypothetical protein LTR17_014523 [Elasticomyces elasticus]